MGRACAVPKCRTGYKSTKEKCSVFRAPQNTEQFKKWQAAIPGNVLKQSQVVCEKHFEPKCILREWVKHDLEGRIIAKVSYLKPRLVESAVPTIFDNLTKSESPVSDKTTDGVIDDSNSLKDSKSVKCESVKEPPMVTLDKKSAPPDSDKPMDGVIDGSKSLEDKCEIVKKPPMVTLDKKSVPPDSDEPMDGVIDDSNSLKDKCKSVKCESVKEPLMVTLEKKSVPPVSDEPMDGVIDDSNSLKDKCKSVKSKRIIKARFLHNGRRVLALAKKPDAPVSERIQILRSTPTSKGSGGVTCRVARVLSSTELARALQAGEETRAQVASDCLRSPGDHIYAASIANKGERIIKARFLQNGRKVIAIKKLAKKPDALVSERIQILRSTPTSKGSGEETRAQVASDCLPSLRDHIYAASKPKGEIFKETPMVTLDSECADAPCAMPCTPQETIKHEVLPVTPDPSAASASPKKIFISKITISDSPSDVVNSEEDPITIPTSWGVTEYEEEGGQRVFFSNIQRTNTNGTATTIINKSLEVEVDKTLRYCVYGRRIDPERFQLPPVLTDTTLLPRTLNKFRGMNICQGLGPVNSHHLSVDTVFQDSVQRWRTNNCTMLAKQKRCEHCKRMRQRTIQRELRSDKTKDIHRIRNLSNPIDRWKLIALREKISREKRVNNYSKRRIQVLTESLEERTKELSSIRAESLNEKILQLQVPAIQQIAIKEIIAAATKKDAKSRRYSDDWITLCIMMHERSPSYYEFLREHDILPLACASTIRNYFPLKNEE